MKITALMATCGRHYFCERSVGMFLAQTYENKHLLILQNSEISQNLDKDYSNITLINKYGYTSLSEIYNDMLNYIPLDTDVVCFFDDDDIYHINHLSEGNKGLLRGGKKAYKPNRSYFQNGSEILETGNTLEPSWFIDASIIKSQKFKTNSNHHHKNWIDWCIENNQLFDDPLGPKTMAYTWGNLEKPVFKTSGNENNPENFSNYRKFSTDHGDGIITPFSEQYLSLLYNNFPEWKTKQ
jgi:hypothetical protein